MGSGRRNVSEVPKGIAPIVAAQLKSYVIYLLIGDNGQPCYVGQTCDTKRRLIEHRAKFGKSAAMQILQSGLSKKEVSMAEQAWIDRYQELIGNNLANVIHTEKAKGPRELTLARRQEGKWVTVSIRNMPKLKWKEVQAVADKKNIKMRGVLDEMLDEWLKRHSK